MDPLKKKYGIIWEFFPNGGPPFFGTFLALNFNIFKATLGAATFLPTLAMSLMSSTVTVQIQLQIFTLFLS